MNFISICFHLSNGVFDHIFHTILNNNTPKITHPYEIQVIDNHFEVKLSKKYNWNDLNYRKFRAFEILCNVCITTDQKF